MIFVCYFQKRHILELLAKNTSAKKYTLGIKCNTNIILAIYEYFIVGLTKLICFYGKLKTNLQLNTNMKVNSNLWQHVSSFHEGSVAIHLEFPSRII